jgi:hypothetical protein
MSEVISKRVNVRHGFALQSERPNDAATKKVIVAKNMSDAESA